MGYSYTMSGRLCCDSCGGVGARKHRCPFGWCPADALCQACRKKHAAEINTAAHRARGCETASARYKAERARERALLDAGQSVRCSAMNAGPDRVHVLFRNAAGRLVGYYMAPATYDALPLGVQVTPDDYRQHGALEDAPDDFQRA